MRALDINTTFKQGDRKDVGMREQFLLPITNYQLPHAQCPMPHAHKNNLLAEMIKEMKS
ncbi:hypothetical protein HCG51_33765 [Tolypothrix sp. PCC 7910]|uniref:hypothetical protein n=1 Tax=Tolypothrix sp. PCC 7910 TaxID=2099387 RepID=UPI0014277104|nr:hypothetical protein [Tolypothrix sp. PCC 7910]QIR41161.1 hypothetical protein HCG51_33765 [Tolypothrix sp. PCC 7910]